MNEGFIDNLEEMVGSIACTGGDLQDSALGQPILCYADGYNATRIILQSNVWV
jgi:hypothetical protein